MIFPQGSPTSVSGDSGYPLSDILIRPYTNEEALRDASKRRFNRRLSGLRTVMSENIFGIWKRRFPVLKNMRNHLPLAKKVIVACAILHNMSIMWRDELPADDHQEQPEEQGAPDHEVVIVEDRAEAHVVRQRGQIVRDQLRATLDRR